MKNLIAVLLALLAVAVAVSAQEKRKVIIDQDCAGPGGTDTQAILALIQSPTTEVLGITIVTGDEWQPEETLHALRLMEIIGRTDIPVVPGATFPLVNTKEFIARWETLYGKIVYQGAWNYARGHAVHGPYDIPPMPEGMPTTKPADEDAAHFLVRMVHQVSAPDHDLRRRPAHESRSRAGHRSGIRVALERADPDGREPQSDHRRSRIHRDAAPRI